MGRTAPRFVSACLVPCGAKDSGRSFVQVPVGGETCTDLGAGATATIVTRDEARLSVGFNKTILGDGAGATLGGASVEFRGSSHIILRNLIFQDVNPTLLEASDALTIQNAHHIWIDHCTFKQFSDDAIDVISSSGAGGADDVPVVPDVFMEPLRRRQRRQLRWPPPRPLQREGSLHHRSPHLDRPEPERGTHAALEGNWFDDVGTLVRSGLVWYTQRV